MFTLAESILAVFATAFFLMSAPARAADLPKAFTDHRSLVKLNDADQAAVQKLFDEIYKKIRIEGDPATPPKIVLMRSEKASAFVYPNEPGFVFFNADFVLGAPNLDVIAAVYAHELTHFEKNQRNRGGTDQGAFLNEVEAETRGIVDRLVRTGKIDSETKQPQTAVYNLEAVIGYFEKTGEYSSTHPNAAHIALGLKAVFALERYRRKFPAVTSAFGLTTTQRLRLVAAAALTPAIKAGKAAPTPEHQLVREMVAELRTSPLQKIKELHGKIMRGYKPGLTAPTPLQLGRLKELFKELDTTAIHVLGNKPGNKPVPASYLQEFANLPTGIFSDLLAVRKLLPPVLDESQYTPYTVSLLEQLAKLEAYIEGISKGATILQNDLLTPMSTPEQALSQDYAGIYLRVLVARHEAAVLAAFTKKAWPHLELMTLVARHPDAFKAPRLVAALDHFSKTVTAEEAVRELTEKRITLDDFSYLDWDRKARTHRFPLAVRLRIAEHAETEMGPGKVSPSLNQAQLFAGEPAHFRQHLAKPGSAPTFSHLVGYLYRAGETLSPDEIEETFLPLLDKAFGRAKIHPDGAKESDFQKLAKAFQEKLIRNRKYPKGDWYGFGANIDKALAILDRGMSEAHFMAALRCFVGDLARRDVSVDVYHSAAHYLAQYLPHAAADRETYLSLPANLPPGIRKRIAAHVTEMAPYVMGYASLNTSLEFGPPWAEIFQAASAEQIATFFPRERIPYNNPAMYEYFNAAVRAMTEKIQNNQAADVDLFYFLKSADVFLKGSTPDLEKLVEAVEKKLDAQGTTRRLEFLQVVRPTAFASPGHYRDFVKRQMKVEVAGRAAQLSGKARAEGLRALRLEIEEKLFKSMDPLLQRDLMEATAAAAHAVPSERPIFKVDLSEHESRVAEGAVYLNEILDVYDGLKSEEKLLLLEWVRGQRPNLTPEILGHIDRILQKYNRHVPTESLEAYVRNRFNSLSPMARGTFFQIALDGPEGFLKTPSWRRYFEKQLFASLPDDIRGTVQELFNAGIKALPPTLRNLAFSLAYAESGTHGSPEQALRLFFSRMGPLVKKVGQNLAFDSHLPESYRLELRKLWDENEPPDWWHMYDLVERQYGKIWEHGYKVVAIRNSGSTEIMLEIEGPDGTREIIAVQREALLIGSETDFQDLKNYVKAVTKRWGGRRKYGFLEVLVEDAARTMAQEANPVHKRRMNELMRAAYQRAAERIGGTVHDNIATVEGWSFQSVTYHDRPLGDGHTIQTVGIAPGVPLKELAKSDPALYKSLSTLILKLENEAQQDGKAPIDKDRMPGQVFVDVPSRTVTMLDPGQASVLDSRVMQARDGFIGASLAVSTAEINVALAPLGMSLNWFNRQRVALHLAAVPPELRPLQMLHWLRSHGAVPAASEGHYWDLVHAVRGKMRLAQWGEDIGSTLLREEWTSLAHGKVGTTGIFIEGCRRALRILGR